MSSSSTSTNAASSSEMKARRMAMARMSIARSRRGDGLPPIKQSQALKEESKISKIQGTSLHTMQDSRSTVQGRSVVSSTITDSSRRMRRSGMMVLWTAAKRARIVLFEPMLDASSMKLMPTGRKSHNTAEIIAAAAALLRTLWLQLLRRRIRNRSGCSSFLPIDAGRSCSSER